MNVSEIIPIPGADQPLIWVHGTKNAPIWQCLTSHCAAIKVADLSPLAASIVVHASATLEKITLKPPPVCELFNLLPHVALRALSTDLLVDWMNLCTLDEASFSALFDVKCGNNSRIVPEHCTAFGTDCRISCLVFSLFWGMTLKLLQLQHIRGCDNTYVTSTVLCWFSFPAFSPLP